MAHVLLILLSSIFVKTPLNRLLNQTTRMISVLVALLVFVVNVEGIGEVIYAVNCGGGPHTDLNGVHYQADKISVGTASDFGKSLNIDRVAPADQPLYQTERYHVADFGYSIPIKDEGDFLLVLKFCEVYFRGSKLKVKNLHLCAQPTLISISIWNCYF